jgi:hypothetical protein
MRLVLVMLGLLSALACGSPRPEPRPSSTPPAPPPSTAEHEEPIVDIHEWGLIDVDMRTGTAELATGPGLPARPTAVRKPVLYLHLLRAMRSGR